MLALIVLSALLVLCKLAYRWLRKPSRSLRQQLLRGDKSRVSVLLVTAHPDDECMFFGPTCRALLADGPFSPFTVHLLCLSRGQPLQSSQSYSSESLLAQSFSRVKELQRSCRHLGISTCLCAESDFVDGFDQWWPDKDVAAAIKAAVDKSAADIVISFDARGVSGHPNHRALFHGLVRFAAQNPQRCFVLESIHPIFTVAKYIGPLAMILDAMYQMLAERISSKHRRCVAVPDPLNEYWIVRRAMAEHASQLTWYRRLYLLFSRYLYVNSLREITL